MRRSHSSHSSSFSRSYRSRGTSSIFSGRVRSNQPTGIPSHLLRLAVRMHCKNHDYVYYKEAWTDEATGVSYRKGYYDENGTYYDGDSIVFKKPDGSYEAHYVCEFCGTEFETEWKEGFYPTCKNCGAEMNKTPVYVDEIIKVATGEDSYDDSDMMRRRQAKISMFIFGIMAIFFIIMFVSIAKVNREVERSFTTVVDWDWESEYVYSGEDASGYETETNLWIYGTDIYLDEISPNIYRICGPTEDYEKHITWDYGANSYYDYDSNCYLWYNTDVSPNLWQYWYDDIAGDNYYGWMECEGEDWYIEVSDGEWALYEGDTDELWHIENSFD